MLKNSKKAMMHKKNLGISSVGNYLDNKVYVFYLYFVFFFILI